jgi:nucleotide-binding universal stress UspA family protein
MKTIVVLTDFSTEADNAAHYALHLAQQLQTNVLLYNTFLSPLKKVIGVPDVWPAENFDELKNDSELELALLAERLKEELTGLPLSAFEPSIIGKSRKGNLSPNLNWLLADPEIMLLVIGSHKKAMSDMAQGNHMREIINDISFPVLIIPENYTYKIVDNIAFATDMTGSDIKVIQSLTELAKPSGAEILLAHICADQSVYSDYAHWVKKFLSMVSEKINYPHIHYLNLPKGNIQSALNRLIRQDFFDVLVMVHRENSFLEQLFNWSNTQRMAANLHMPLLVYPDPLHTVSNF